MARCTTAVSLYNAKGLILNGNQITSSPRPLASGDVSHCVGSGNMALECGAAEVYRARSLTCDADGEIPSAA